jgi:hypothetical protein
MRGLGVRETGSYARDMSFEFHGEIRGDEWHGSQDLRTSNDSSSTDEDEGLVL